MALVNPNIALGVRGVEIPNQLAQYAQIQQIQNAQNQNRMANMQMQEYERARGEEEGLRNYLASNDFKNPAARQGLFQFGKTGREYLRSLTEQDTAALTKKKTQLEIDDKDFELKKKRLDRSLTDFANFNSVADVLGHIQKQLNTGEIDQAQAQQLASQVPQSDAELPAFQIAMLRRTLGAKEQLDQSAVTTKDTDRGGFIERQKYDKQGKAVGEPVKLEKTATIGEKTGQGQLAVAQGNAATSAGQLKVAQERLAFDKSKGTPLTESQGNATAFGLRMKEANKILTDLETIGEKDTGLIKNTVGSTLGLIPFLGDKLEGVTGSVFNVLPQILGGLSPAQQKVAQARINFITALLRKESGAAIAASEFATAEKNYFPKPGEGADVIKQKQKARETAIKAMDIQAGPGATQMGGAGGLPGASANNPLGLPGL